MDEGGFIDEAAATERTLAQQRAAVRESMLLMATLRPDADPAATMSLRVRNLSAGGLMAECDRKLTRGERVEVDLRGIGPIAGFVAWASPGRVGIAFDREIDPKATRKPVGTGAGTSKILVGYDGRRPGLR